MPVDKMKIDLIESAISDPDVSKRNYAFAMKLAMALKEPERSEWVNKIEYAIEQLEMDEED